MGFFGIEFVTLQVLNVFTMRGNEKVHTTTPSVLQTAAKCWKGCVGVFLISSLGLIQAPGIMTFEMQQ